MVKFLHENKLPFYSDLRDLVLEDIYSTKRIAKCILIDGIPGSGKTTLAVHIADYFAKKPIRLENKDHPQLAMGGLNFIEQSIDCSDAGMKVVIYDEAGDFAKTGAMTRFNKMMYEYFTQARALNIITIICVQRFWHMDKKIFELGVVQALIHCHDANEGYTRYGVYDADGIGWLRTYIEKYKTNPQLAYRRQHPYIRGIFLNLPPVRELALQRLSTRQKKKRMKSTKKTFLENAMVKK